MERNIVFRERGREKEREREREREKKKNYLAIEINLQKWNHLCLPHFALWLEVAMEERV